MGSKSSYGRENSSRKKGWPFRFSEGEGERMDTGDELDLDERYPSASISYVTFMKERRSEFKCQ